MSLIKYEFEKLKGIKYAWIMLILCLLANAGLCIYQTKDAGNIPVSELERILEIYKGDPQTLIDYKAEIDAWKKKRNEIMDYYFSQGIFDFPQETWENKYTSDDITDEALIGALFSSIDYIENGYDERVQTVIYSAVKNRKNLISMGLSEKDYTVKFQDETLKVYGTIAGNVDIDLEIANGWDDYFGYNAVNIFIFICVLIFGVSVFGVEQSSGFINIVRLSKNGRARTAAAKLATMVALTLAVVLLFTLSTLAVFALRTGLSSASNALQAFEEFALCPFQITVGDYFWLALGFKFFAFVLFAIAVMALSLLLRELMLTYIGGAAFLGVNFILYLAEYSNPTNPWRNLNLLAVTFVHPFFKSYKALNLFGNVVDYISFFLAVFSVFIAVFVTYIILSYARGNQMNRSIIRLLSGKLKSFSRQRRSTEGKRVCFPRLRTCSISLVSFEARKTLQFSRLLIVLLILLLKILVTNDTLMPRVSKSDDVYKEYMTLLSGEMTEEKAKYLADTRAAFNEAIANKEIMQEKLENNGITTAEYREYASTYNFAMARSRHLQRIEEHASYINRLAREGKEAHFIYDTGWSKIFFSDFDWLMIAVLLLLYTSSFSIEYGGRSSAGDFAQILRTTKKGRGKIFRSKYLSCALSSFFIGACFFAVELVTVIRDYDLPQLLSPIHSIESLEKLPFEMPILGYVVLFFTVKLTATLILTAFICSLSALLKKPMSVFACSLIPVAIPAMFVFFGLNFMKYADFCDFMRVSPMLIRENNFAMYLSVWLAVCILLAVFAWRDWTGNIKIKRKG